MKSRWLVVTTTAGPIQSRGQPEEERANVTSPHGKGVSSRVDHGLSLYE
jgi:hypothetical protein